MNLHVLSHSVPARRSSDVFDARFFENQARKMAEAIETAAANLKPARMGATQIHHRVYKGNVVRLATAIDGTPAGYPLEYNDHGLVVMRFDDLSDPARPKPLAAWVSWGEIGRASCRESVCRYVYISVVAVT